MGVSLFAWYSTIQLVMFVDTCAAPAYSLLSRSSGDVEGSRENRYTRSLSNHREERIRSLSDGRNIRESFRDDTEIEQQREFAIRVLTKDSLLPNQKKHRFRAQLFFAYSKIILSPAFSPNSFPSSAQK